MSIADTYTLFLCIAKLVDALKNAPWAPMVHFPIHNGTLQMPFYVQILVWKQGHFAHQNTCAKNASSPVVGIIQLCLPNILLSLYNYYFKFITLFDATSISQNLIQRFLSIFHFKLTLINPLMITINSYMGLTSTWENMQQEKAMHPQIMVEMVVYYFCSIHCCYCLH